METPPDRFSPDNSEEARARRVAQTSDYPAYDHALAWVRFRVVPVETQHPDNVVPLPEPKEPPEDIVA